ncbi:unnamed protein product [Closterium sp. NIES-54]
MDGVHRATAGDCRIEEVVNNDVEVLGEDNYELWAKFCVAHLLIFMVISRCHSPLVQIALKPCRLRVGAGYQAWQFIMRTYKATDDLYIGQMEQRLTNIRMGDQVWTTKYCNRARRNLAEPRMASVDYSVASYVTHVIKGL